MNWIDVIGQGGAWGLALGLGYAVLSGRLRLGREVTDRDKRIEELEGDNKNLASELKLTAQKAEDAIRTEAQATRQELAEMRKTNADLVAAVTTMAGKGAGT